MFNKHKGPDFLIAQVYVDDIIFGGSLPALVTVFVEQMKFEFELSIMGELTFFLGFQIRHCRLEISLSQEKYS